MRGRWFNPQVRSEDIFFDCYIWRPSINKSDEPRHASRVLRLIFFEISNFYKVQKNYLFITICENMVVVSLLFTFLEHFKVIYPNMCWYVFMTSLEVVNRLANLPILRNMRHVHFYAILT